MNYDRATFRVRRDIAPGLVRRTCVIIQSGQMTLLDDDCLERHLYDKLVDELGKRGISAIRFDMERREEIGRAHV